MNKPKNLELLEKFSQFLKSNGYDLTIFGDYDSMGFLFKLKMPDGEILSMETGRIASSDEYIFDQDGYDNYVENAKLSGFDDPYPNSDSFWTLKE